MPSCRRPLAPFPIPVEHRRVRLSRYIVNRRIPPRATNDNRRPWSAHAWQWALAIVAGPTLTAALMLSGLF